MSDYSDIIVEEDGPVAVVRLNRPDRLNSMGGTMMSELVSYLDSLNSGDYRIRAVVLTGAGRAFCAGGDVLSFPAVNAERARRVWRRPHGNRSATGAMRDCDAPIIGAINGYAVGGGFGLALATDFRICADDAIFQVTQIKRGITADVGLGFLLQAEVGTQRALELIATARRVDAREALDLGLVLEVVPKNELIERAVEIAKQVSANTPLGIAAAKRLVYMPHNDDLARVEELTGMYVGKLFETEDGREGAVSFVERREPIFKGR
ncbi:MAG: enoyl-CoA hydratase/isomerase family protein [Frankiaceae bacterium]|jgi:enoyl-CoA hydratase/carnithine racemase|nr:enoyl-CoA hydratase/isomerase family protein [Frankiaceae bacterium]